MSEIHSETDFEGQIPGPREIERAQPDPVAVLKLAMKAALPGAFLQADDLALGSEAAGKVLAEQGYVLVNEKRLAALGFTTDEIETMATFAGVSFDAAQRLIQCARAIAKLPRAEQGYVLVNAEGLAAAWDQIPERLPFFPWYEASGEEAAAAILAAIQEQER